MGRFRSSPPCVVAALALLVSSSCSSSSSDGSPASTCPTNYQTGAACTAGESCEPGVQCVACQGGTWMAFSPSCTCDSSTSKLVCFSDFTCDPRQTLFADPECTVLAEPEDAGVCACLAYDGGTPSARAATLDGFLAGSGCKWSFCAPELAAPSACAGDALNGTSFFQGCGLVASVRVIAGMDRDVCIYDEATHKLVGAAFINDGGSGACANRVLAGVADGFAGFACASACDLCADAGDGGCGNP